MTNPVLDIRDLSVQLRIGGELRPVLDGVSLAIDAGEAVGVVGESGAGKSMTARCIARALPPSAVWQGDILFDGQSIRAFRGAALRAYRGREIQMIFQDPKAHINPVRTVGDFATEALRLVRGYSKAEATQRILSNLVAIGVSHPEARLKQYPHELSGGLLQRVMIASALAAQPRLLIADEPTTALDVTTQAEVVGLLDELRRERGLGLLFITHDLELAAAICDRTAVMYAGMLVEDRPSASLHVQPRHPYTIALLRSRPSAAQRASRLPAIPGRPISAYEAGAGCPFAPRCPYAEPECEAQRPALLDLDGGRVACLRAAELAESVEAPDNSVVR